MNIKPIFGETKYIEMNLLPDGTWEIVRKGENISVRLVPSKCMHGIYVEGLKGGDVVFRYHLTYDDFIRGRERYNELWK